MKSRPAMLAASLCVLAFAASAAAPTTAPGAPAREPSSEYQHLLDAANAVVGIKVRALANARSAQTLGIDRVGSGVLIAHEGLVLTIGYLILEADQVDVTTSKGRTVPATVAAYDHATGFGLLRPIVALDAKPIKLGSSGRVEASDRVLVAGSGGEDNVSVATVVSRRRFAGYWEYLIEGAIFTSPPRADFGGAALINKEGELVGIGSLFVMDAITPGERQPGNMFVPIDLLKPVLDEMIATGRQKGGVRPWLGINSVEDDGRIKVVRVTPDSPADKAGIEAGDVLLALDSQKLETLPDFYRLLWASGKPGVEVSLKVLHEGDIRVVRVRSMDRFEHMRKKPTI